MKSFFGRAKWPRARKGDGKLVFPEKGEVALGNGFAMDARTDIKKRLPIRHVTEGPERAPHRRPRDIVTWPSHLNAAAVVAASGGSINAALHLPAIVHQCGIRFDRFDVAEIFKKTPYVADLEPRGRDVAKDMFEGGGTPVLMKTLLDHADVGTPNVKLTDAERAERKTKWKARATNHTSGAPRKYAQQVGPVVDGAVIHLGGAREKQCYADI